MNELPNEIEEAIEALGPCDDCDGRGSIGIATDGRQVSCEACGGHEDALGTGIASQDKGALIAAIAKALAAARDEALNEVIAEAFVLAQPGGKIDFGELDDIVLALKSPAQKEGGGS